jgi:outer membrane receptor protein involved in Fe transport
VTNKGNWLDKNYTLTYGFNYGAMQDARLDREADMGQITAAGQASPTRDETQKASNMDLYVQGLYALDARWDLHAGLRYSVVQLEIADKDGSPATGSGKLEFAKTIPVAGVVYKVNPTMNLYANAGLGFETPTLVEITYADPNNAAAGPNLSLVPSTSQNAELGAKFFTSDTSVLNTAVFYITTENNRVVVGDTNVTNAYIQVAWTVVSDERDKADIEDVSYGLDFISKLRTVKFKRDNRNRYEDRLSDGSKKDEKFSYGFLAQNVIEAEKACGATDKSLLVADNEDENNLKLTETNIIPALVKALQELKAEFDAYKSSHP